MSNFHSLFQSFFTEEERESELYRILATIGVNTEKAIYEEIDAEIRRATEASVFTDQKLRSWLSFFLMPVRNVVSASGIGRIVLNSFATTYISGGDIILGRNGKDYEVQEDIVLSGNGDSMSFSYIQGHTVPTEAMEYSEFIAIPIDSGNVDLSDIKVTFTDGKPIPLAQPFPSYSTKLNTVLSVINPEEVPEDLLSLVNPAEVSVALFDGEKEAFINSLKSLWSTIQEVSVRPSCGFFPFFYNNTLYIKIFPGGDPLDDNYVPEPKGQQVKITYRVSDGLAGNIGKDQFLKFQKDIIDTTANQADYTLFNDAASNGVNAPTHAELVNLLRRRFFASTHVSSVPEYTTWFLSQPEVGDCLIVSDYDRWRMSGDTSLKGHAITGTVEVYLLDDKGDVVDPGQPGAYTSYIKGLDLRLDGVRDIAFVVYKKPAIFFHFYVIQYRSVADETNFLTWAQSHLPLLYDKDWVRANDLSLFKDLDLELVTAMVRGNFNPAGLRIIPYHYHEELYDVSSGTDFNFPYFFGEKPGGWYEFWEFKDPEMTILKEEPTAIYKEFVQANGVNCDIYRYKKEQKYIGDEPCGWKWSQLDGDSMDAYVGSRLPDGSVGVVSFNMGKAAPLIPGEDPEERPPLGSGVMRCFWAIENEGIMPVGGDVSVEFGVRKLPVVPDSGEKTEEQTYFKDKVKFEKYI